MVLLVVDTQKGIVDERLYAFEKFVSNIKELIRTAREQGIEVVYSSMTMGPAPVSPSGMMSLISILSLHHCRPKNGSSRLYATLSRKRADCWNI